MSKNKFEEISKEIYRSIVTFAEVSSKDKPMGRYQGLPVFVNYGEQPAHGGTYECFLNHSSFGNFYQAILIEEILPKGNFETTTPNRGNNHGFKPLNVCNGVLIVPELGTTNLKVISTDNKNRIILSPARYGELRSENDVVDVTSIIRVFGNRTPCVHQSPDYDIIFEFGGANHVF